MTYNIYVVETPLQLINCIEAANSAITINNVLIVNTTFSVNNDRQILELIDTFCWSRVVFFNRKSLSKPYITALYRRLYNQLYHHRFLKEIKQEYLGKVDELYIGEFRSVLMHDIRGALSPKTTFLVDDGTVTLKIQSDYLSKKIHRPENSLMFCSWKSRAKKIIQDIINYQFRSAKVIAEPIHLFTTFDIQPLKNQLIVRNSYESYKKKQIDQARIEGSVFYFGSKYSEAGVLTLDQEVDFLFRIVKFYNSKNLKFVYVPHRADSKEKLHAINKRLNVEVLDLKLPAEIYFFKSSEIPEHISGAYTTVLNNIAPLFEFTSVLSFKLPRSVVPDAHQEVMRLSYANLQSLGVEVVDLYE